MLTTVSSFPIFFSRCISNRRSITTSAYFSSVGAWLRRDCALNDVDKVFACGLEPRYLVWLQCSGACLPGLYELSNTPIPVPVPYPYTIRYLSLPLGDLFYTYRCLSMRPPSQKRVRFRGEADNRTMFIVESEHVVDQRASQKRHNVQDTACCPQTRPRKTRKWIKPYSVNAHERDTLKQDQRLEDNP